jgi:hypothetical protein
VVEQTGRKWIRFYKWKIQALKAEKVSIPPGTRYQWQLVATISNLALFLFTRLLGCMKTWMRMKRSSSSPSMGLTGTSTSLELNGVLLGTHISTTRLGSPRSQKISDWPERSTKSFLWMCFANTYTKRCKVDSKLHIGWRSSKRRGVNRGLEASTSSRWNK